MVHFPNIVFQKPSLSFLPTGQRSGHPDREPVLQAEADAGQEGRKQEQRPAGAPAENQRPPGGEGHPLPNRRHHVLLRLRADAPAAAHPRRGKVFRRL